MRKIHAMGVVGLLLARVALGAGSSAAQDEYQGWTARLWGGAVARTIESDNATFTDPTFGTVELSYDDPSPGFGGDIEYRLNKLLGLDLAIGYSDLDIDFEHSVGEGTQTDTLGMVPVWLALNFHVINNDHVDFYIGYQMAYVFYLNDLHYDVPDVGSYDFKTDNEFAPFGFNVGADLSVTDEWAVNFAFRFQDADADAGHNLPIDPTFITLGVARKL